MNCRFGMSTGSWSGWGSARIGRASAILVLSALVCGGAHAATVTWINPAGGNWSEGANWDSGTPPTSADDVVIDPPSPVTVTVDTASSALSLDLASGHTLSLSSALSLGAGTSLLRGTVTGAADLVVAGTLDWQEGTMTGSGSTNILAGATLELSGLIEISERTLRNEGTASNPFGDASLDITNGGFFENVNTLELTGGFDVSGALTNTGTIRNTAGANTLDGPFDNQSLIDVPIGTLSLGNGTSSGTIDVASGAVLEVTDSFNPTTGCVFTIAPAGTIDGEGTVRVTKVGGVGTTFTADGTWNLSGPIEFVTGVTNEPGVLNLNGPITAITADISIQGGVFNLNSDPPGPFNSITIMGLDGDTSSLFSVSAPSPVTVANLDVSGLDDRRATLGGSGKLVVTESFLSAGGFATLLEIEIASTATATLSSGTSIQAHWFFADAVNYGTFNVNGGNFRIENASRFENRGAFHLASPYTSFGTAFATDVFANYGTFTFTVPGTLFSQSTIVNYGIVDIQTGKLEFRHPYVQHSGSTILNGGTIGGAIDIRGGSVSGSGIISGADSNPSGQNPATVTISGGATVRPGSSAGTLTIEGNYTQTSTGILELEVGGVSPELNDHLNVTGNASLAGRLAIVQLPGLELFIGDALEAMTYGSRTGDFTIVSGNQLGGQRSLMPQYQSSSMLLEVVNNPPPSIGAIDPAVGLTTGGDDFTVTGSNFQEGASVVFDTAVATGITVVDSSTLTGITPAHAAGTVDVEVRNPDGQTVLGFDLFTFVVPPPPVAIDSITPSSGPTTGGTLVTISGDGFLDGAIVEMDGRVLGSVSIVDQNTLTARTVPHAPGPVDVSVTNTSPLAPAGGESDTLTAGFTYVCTTVSTPTLLSPASGVAGQSTSPTVTWTVGTGDFQYDLYLDQGSSPQTIVASNLPADPSGSFTAYPIANLEPGTTYYWKVVAKGDPTCAPQSTAESVVFSFTTAQACLTPAGFDTISPADLEADVSSSPTLTWQASAGAGTYDVYFGQNYPPPLHTSAVTGTTLPLSGLNQATTYFWSVVARAGCDPSNSSATPVRAFTVAGDCTIPVAFGLATPANESSLPSTAATLSWNPSAGATAYDLYLGTTSDPPLAQTGLADTSARVEGLTPDTTYYWKVVARASCDPADDETSAVFSFTTGSICNAPSATQFVFLPPGSVGIGQTYTIAWKSSTGFGQGGSYEVQRSTDAGFGTILDTQRVPSTFATFIADEVGTYYHRVRAVAGCDETKSSAPSPTGEVTVTTGQPSVIFTVQPEATITELNADLSTVSSRFVLENLSPDPVTVIIGRQEINSQTFFTIVDPEGGEGFLTLDPRTPKELLIQYAGPSTDTAGSYQGVIFLASTGSQLTVTPYAFVNLKVGGQTSVTPRFLVDGAISEYVFFPPFSGEDATRPGIEVAIRNGGSSPMELGAEIGPEVWLVPEDGWNATPLVSGEVRTIQLFTRRSRAPAGSSLPRYTYFTIRTRDGKTARLLVQDNDESSIGSGRGAALSSGESSLIVPDVVSELSASSTPMVTQLHLTNLGSVAVQADLYFTPTGVSGLSASVKRATIVVPPNDVVTLTDPLVVLYALTRPARGQIELRASPETLGLLQVKAGVVSARGTASALATIPVVSRGEGARTGAPHRLAGITKSATQVTSIVLAETTGTETTTIELTLHSKSGVIVGSQSYVIEPYGHIDLPDIVATLGGGSNLDGARIEVGVASGGGAVIAIGKVSDLQGEDTATIVSEPAPIPASGSAKRIALMAEATTTLALPMVVQGPIDAGSTTQYQTVVGFVAPPELPADFSAIFTSSVGSVIQKTFTVPAGQTREHTNVVSQLFTVTTPVIGSMTVVAPAGAQIYSWLTASGTQTGSVPVIDTGGVLVSSATGSSSPLHYDGMEQSTDPSRGTRWNLYLQETSGQSGTARVSLYEAANRSYPIIQKDFPVAANARVPLETVFAATGLDSALRRKDRTNVLCVVRPVSGSAAITATAVEIDNATGAVQVHPLEPGTGLSSTLVTVRPVAGQGGDANGDGSVGVADIFFLINHIFAGGPAPVGSGDANGDGAVGVADIFFLINYIFAGGPAPV